MIFNLVTAIIKCLASNLVKLSPCIPGKSKRESKYKQIRRFLKRYKFDTSIYVNLVLWIICFDTYTLTLDRTNWKFWKKNINILTLWIVYKWTAIPILRCFLNKRGNSNHKERIKLLDKFIKVVGKDKIQVLLADREFVWLERINYLLANKIDFCIRIKYNIISWGKYIWDSFKHLEYNKPLIFKKKLYIERWWCKVWISWMKIKDDYVIVAHSYRTNKGLEDYKQRWEIETLFWCLKTRWFNFEETHLKKVKRLNNLLHILALSFIWCHKTWERLSEIKSILIKTHWRKEYSIFKYWLQYLRNLLLSNQNWLNYNHCVLQKLSCT